MLGYVISHYYPQMKFDYNEYYTKVLVYCILDQRIYLDSSCFFYYNKEKYLLNKMYSKILQQLDNTDFPKNYCRKNISKTPTQSFVLGEINLRGQKFLNYKTRGISRWSKKFSELYDLLKDF